MSELPTADRPRSVSEWSAPAFSSPRVRLYHGNALDVLPTLPDRGVHCVVTSPPYWGLRKYAGVEPSVWGGDPAHAHEWGAMEKGRRKDIAPADVSEAGRLGTDDRQDGALNDGGRFCACGAWLGCLGNEPTPALFVSHLVTIFREVRRVLRDDGTLWLNLGDSYSGSGRGPTGKNGIGKHDERQGFTGGYQGDDPRGKRRSHDDAPGCWGLKAKDLCMVPWRSAIALQEDGWYLRSAIAWAKLSAMPESVTDRPTSAWEPIFLFSKSSRYYYDAQAVKQPQRSDHGSGNGFKREARQSYMNADGTPRGNDDTWDPSDVGANLRNFWLLGPEPFGEAHFAVFPSEIPRRAILAGSPEGGIALDPFAGSCTTLAVARDAGREGVGIEASREYVDLAVRTRLRQAVLL